MMKRILVIGAGRSSTVLIDYLLNNAQTEDWFIRLGDMDGALAKSKINNHPRAEAFQLNALNAAERWKAMEGNDLIISMLPAIYHNHVAFDAVKLRISVITPSYISEEMKGLDQEARAAGIVLLNEMGVDPGIDHMSAMQLVDRIRAKGGKLLSFESFTGGLIAPESDNNPWGYKFSWNPKNVVLAGQGGAARYIQEGSFKYIPYHQLFKRYTEISIDGLGKFEGYANRDSLRYRSIYNMEGIPTLYRGTLRKEGFCDAWNVFVQLGCTDDSYQMEGLENMSLRQYLNSFLPFDEKKSLEEKLKGQLNLQDAILQKMEWLGFFSNEAVGMSNASPAQVLQKVLESKWVLEPEDKDMIVMWHRFIYEDQHGKHELRAHLVNIGDDNLRTAMAKTVGLPLAIAAKCLLNGTINCKGVQLPVSADIYEPILSELEDFGIKLEDYEVSI